MFSDLLSTENLEKTREIMKERRVVMNMTQKEAAERAGVNIRTLQHFEQKGEISFLNLLKLMSVYHIDERVMKSIEDRSWWTIEQMERAEKRKRAR
jgi:transcriptional regulator with XRE-family HTH domain